MGEAARQALPRLVPSPRRAPGPQHATVLGFLSKALHDPLGYVLRVRERYGDVVRVNGWPLFFHVLVHPDHVRHVLQENNRNYWKGETVAKMKVLIGEGLFTSEGDFWRRQRKLAQPAFHRQHIDSFATIMSEATADTLERWRAPAEAGKPVDVLAEMSRLALTIVGQALFSLDLSGSASEVGDAMLVALEVLTQRVLHPYNLPLWLPTPRHRALRQATAELDRVVASIIERRRREGGGPPDLLSLLMSARDVDTGEGMSDRQLRDEVMTFVLAGHETTAVTLAWAFHLLSQHPGVEERTRAEVLRALGQRAPRLADLPGLGAARRVIEETLRLYPAVSVITRQSYQADEIGGYEIPADSILFVAPYATHRHPDFWPSPERFDPDRFLPEAAAERPRFAYFPFGGGPRLCIGNEFALMEATIALAMILQRYRLRPLPGHRVESEVRITLRPKHGLPMVPLPVA